MVSVSKGECPLIGDSHEKKLKKEFGIIHNFIESRKFLNGRMWSTEKKEDGKEYAVVSCEEGIVEVHIPKEKYLSHEISDLKNSVGANVNYIITDLDEKNRIAYGDRLYTMQNVDLYKRLAMEYKDTLLGSVIYVDKKNIIVDALGCDIVIPKKRINTRNGVFIGDRLVVWVTDIGEKLHAVGDMQYHLVRANGYVEKHLEV